MLYSRRYLIKIKAYHQNIALQGLHLSWWYLNDIVCLASWCFPHFSLNLLKIFYLLFEWKYSVSHFFHLFFVCYLLLFFLFSFHFGSFSFPTNATCEICYYELKFEIKGDSYTWEWVWFCNYYWLFQEHTYHLVVYS